MIQMATSAEGYAAQFEAIKEAVSLPGTLAALRDDAFAGFGRLGFPTTRLEDWRFTNVSPIAETQFSVASAPADYE